MTDAKNVNATADNFAIVNGWLSKAVGSDRDFIKATVAALEAVDKDGSTDPLAKMLTITHGKTAKRIKRKEADRMAYAAPLKRIVGHVMGGYSMKYSKDADFGVVFTKGDNAAVNGDLIEALKMMAAQGLTFKSETFKETFPVEKKVKTKTDEEKREQFRKYAEKFAADNGMSVDLLVEVLRGKN